ncbi:amidase [Bradyrhizobium sp. B097]|uniref:amidase n=1 Tax=Bradyrhizobium sp. B097 TaxID=3140244 RepID=UPI003182CBA3
MKPQFTISEASRLFEAGKLSPVELTQDCFSRISAADAQLNSFLLLTEERAMADARASERRWSSGQPKGRLDGIPIAHKDAFDTAGIRTTWNSRILQENVPAEDAVAVRNLAEAGTVLMGKLATYEFGLGGPSFDLPWPPPRNPWNLNYSPAGSSSGTAVAIAAGFILGGTGSDTSGSIRGPASVCGISGIKPTYGLIDGRGILPLSFTLDHAGPMAWTAEDCAFLLQAMVAHGSNEPGRMESAVADFTSGIDGGIKGLRIGVVRHFHEVDAPVSVATRTGIEEGLDVLRELGANITDVSLSPLSDYHACCTLICFAEGYAVHKPWLTTRYYEYSEFFRDRVALGALITGDQYVDALRRQRELCLEMAAAMSDVDILVTTSQATEAIPFEAVQKWSTWENVSFNIPFNVTGYPAISVCSGFGDLGLPVSIQLVAKPYCEPLLLRTAHAFERATSWRRKRPPSFGGKELPRSE